MDDIYYMDLALKEAEKAFALDDVPIGCVIVQDDIVIASSYNRKEIDNIATSHAEVLAINEACKKLGSWYLDTCVLYTTVEPCMMCSGAIMQSRIKRVVYGVNNDSFGYLRKLDSNLEIVGGVREIECKNLISNFFKDKRDKKNC